MTGQGFLESCMWNFFWHQDVNDFQPKVAKQGLITTPNLTTNICNIWKFMAF